MAELDDILNSCLTEFQSNNVDTQTDENDNNISHTRRMSYISDKDYEIIDSNMIDNVLNEIDEHEIEFKLNNKSKYMEQKIEDNIQNATNMHDLYPFIQLLIPMNELQNMLLNKWQTINKTMITNKLYIKSASIDEILSNDVLVNIIKYLNCRDYPSINLLSKTFHEIMFSYVSIYNKYKLHIII
eukprot:142710_1